MLLDELAKHTGDLLEYGNETLHELSANCDTTAALIGWTFYFLSRNPEVFVKLRKEILADFFNRITFAKLRDCQYLRYNINETFRCAAVISAIERMCNKDTILLRGGGKNGDNSVFLPKDSRVLIATYAM